MDLFAGEEKGQKKREKGEKRANEKKRKGKREKRAKEKKRKGKRGKIFVQNIGHGAIFK